MNAVDRILNGAVDMHCHSSPSPFPRRIDHLAAARQANEVGMRAIVVKSHHHSTVTDVAAIGSALDGLRTRVFGGIALNSHVGGLNPGAVELALRMGGKLVWFPTIASPKHLDHHREHPDLRFPVSSVKLSPEEPIDILTEAGDVKPEVVTILELVAEAGAVLATGHLGPDRIEALLLAARAEGVTRLLVNHPEYVIEASEREVARFAELGATIEHSLCMYDEDSTFYHWELDTLIRWIDLVGPDRTSLGSDLGQVDNPLPVESFRKICGRLLDAGLKEAEVRQMVSGNPIGLLGLD